MQFPANSQGTTLPAEYKYLESLRLESSLSPSSQPFTNLYIYPNNHTYSHLNLYSLPKTSKCLPTTAKTPPPPGARPAPAARSCAEPLVLAAPSSGVQLGLDAPSCEEQPVLAARSCKWPHPLADPHSRPLSFSISAELSDGIILDTAHLTSSSKDLPMSLVLFSTPLRLAAAASHIHAWENDTTIPPPYFTSTSQWEINVDAIAAQAGHSTPLPLYPHAHHLTITTFLNYTAGVECFVLSFLSSCIDMQIHTFIHTCGIVTPSWAYSWRCLFPYIPILVHSIQNWSARSCHVSREITGMGFNSSDALTNEV